MGAAKMFPVEQLENLKVSITRLVTDSRAVQKGDTFVAYPGEKTDGRQFIPQAIAQGANAVIWEAQHFVWDDAWQIPNLAVSDLRHKAGWIADAVYGAPSEKLWMIGITGTNGKTSTCHWIAQALGDAGKKCALIGTLGNGFADALQSSANTTPDAISVHGLLADYLHADARAAAMEVSSHALAQGRVNGVRFDVALLTNLSRDHLDYHGDMESYAASKRKLLDWDQLKYAVLNLDDAFGAELAEQLQDGIPLPNPLPQAGEGANEALRAISTPEVIGYGLSDAALQLAERLGLRMVYGNLAEMSGQGLRLDIYSSWGAAATRYCEAADCESSRLAPHPAPDAHAHRVGGAAQLNSALVGRFNAANLLGALAVLLVSGIGLADAVQSLSRVQAVAGRMQRVSGADQPTVIVDYAHTPDALEKVLLTLREVGAYQADKQGGGKLICVFGCGGDRDRGKRPLMGLVAEKFSDYCIVTSDNPRSEDPQHIIAEIVGGMAAHNHEVVIERAAAIERAIGRAQQHDTVLVAGKGHEDYQEISGVKHPFSDTAIAGSALRMWREPA